MPLYEISTIQTFRHKYIIKAECLEHAKDTVVMREAEELTQKWLDEIILDGREITMEEAEQIAKDAQADRDELCNRLDTVICDVECDDEGVSVVTNENRTGEPCPTCGEALISPIGGGVRCSSCTYWFCY
jgi:hypothetical protein